MVGASVIGRADLMLLRYCRFESACDFMYGPFTTDVKYLDRRNSRPNPVKDWFSEKNALFFIALRISHVIHKSDVFDPIN